MKVHETCKTVHSHLREMLMHDQHEKGQTNEYGNNVGRLKPSDSAQIVLLKVDLFRPEQELGREWQSKNEAADQKEELHAAAAMGEDEGSGIVGDLVSLGRNAPGVEGNNRKSREKSQYLNVNQHQLH